MQSLKAFRSKAKAFPDLLNYGALIDDGIVLNKDGSLTAGWFYQGRDIESATSEERNDISARINLVLSKMGNGWTTHQDAIRFSSKVYSEKANSFFPDRITELIDEERRQQFESEGSHYESLYALTVTFLPPNSKQSRFSDLMVGKTFSNKTKNLSDLLIERFKQQLNEIEDGLSVVLKMSRMQSWDYLDDLGNRQSCDQLLQYLHFCITGINQPISIPACPMYLDTLIGSYEFHSGITPKIDKKSLTVVAIEGFPHNSYPNILAGLEQLPITYRWNTRFLYMDSREAVQHLKRYRRKWQQKVRGFMDQVFRTSNGVINQDALEMVGDAENAISEASSQMVGYGYYTSVIVLMDEDSNKLEMCAREVKRMVQSLGFSCRIESVNAVEAYLGSLPAHCVQNIRRPMINTLNLADLIPTYSIWPGHETNPCAFYPAESPALLYGAAEGCCPFRLNLHVGDVGHTLVFGPTGAGKSTLLALIAAQFRRYENAQVFAFDKGKSLFPLSMAVGGQHYDVAGEDSSLCFCPLGMLESDQDQSWAEEWIATSVELQGISVTPGHKNEIHRAMTLLREGQFKTLTDFCTNLQDKALREAMAHYTVSGAMGHLLDSDTDSLNDNSFQVFEIEELMNLGDKNVIPVLLYLFHQIEKRLQGQPTLLVLDEAWIMLGHSVFRDKIREWLKVLRKANCAVILATQSISDAANSGILDVLNESCPTKILLPNMSAKESSAKSLYETLGLNDRQLDIIASATPKHHYYYASPLGRRLFNLNLGPAALAFVGASGKEDIKRIKQLSMEFGDHWPEQWLKEREVFL